jgi:signal transduction histidine kinase
MTGLSPFPPGRGERGRGFRSARAVPGTQTTFLQISVMPAVIIAVLCIGSAVYALAGNASASAVRATLVGVVGGVMLMLIAAVFAASTAGSRVTTQIGAARAVAQRGQLELQRMVERILRGEQPAPVVPAPSPVMNRDPFQMLAHDVEQAQYLAGQGIIRVANGVVGGRADQRVEILVNLARRMQSLVHREIELLDDLEGKVEDPDLLKGLFTVDHLATRMRRQSESLAVLGGSASRRQWTRQVTMHEVLRAAIAEVEHYSRVKVVPPVEGIMRGAAVADIIHLIAELVENATKFSPPRTQVLLRAQMVAAGVAIEVEDRGLGMMPSDQQRMNTLLTDPGEIEIDELLRDGRIGLYVVSTLGRRHGVRVQLKGNIYGGSSAIIVLPAALLEITDDGEPWQGDFSDQEEREPVPVSSPAAAPQPFLPLSPYSVSSPTPEFTPAPEFTQPQMHAVVSRGERPPLPKRQAQAHLAPPLREQPRNDRHDVAEHGEPPADQMPGLMADFLDGVSRSEKEDFPARD